MCRKSLTVTTAVLTVALIWTQTPSLADEGANPGVIPPQARAFGTSYAQLSADWWVRAWETPMATHPVLDPSGEYNDVNQGDKVWFLAGTFFGEPAVRTCTVPVGKALYIPLINSTVFCPWPGETVEDLRDQAAEFIDHVVELEATIDGRTVENLFDYRIQSTVYTVPGGGLFEELGFWPGCVGTEGVDDGFYLLLPPLPVGEHVIQWSGRWEAFEHSLFGPQPEFVQDATYFIEVVNEGNP